MRLLRPVAVRGKRRLLSALLPRRGERLARVFGWQMRVDLAETIQRDIYMGTFEPVETKIVKALLRPGMTVVDVGANVGYYTLLAARQVGETGRVLAFEPNRRAYVHLAQTLALNRVHWVETACLGLGDAAGHATLYLAPDSPMNDPTMVCDPGLAASEEVEVDTLDACLERARCRRVDLLKLDCEGWEPKVIAGAAEALRRGRISAVLCEFNDYWLRAAGSSPGDLWKTFASLGFRDADPREEPNLGPTCLFTRLLVLR